MTNFITPLPQLSVKQMADLSGLKLVNSMKSECQKQFDLAWKKKVNGQLVNKTVEEAQAFFDQYGNKAVLAFQLHGKLQELIYLTDNSWVPLVPPHNYTPNLETGTVVISAKETP